MRARGTFIEKVTARNHPDSIQHANILRAVGRSRTSVPGRLILGWSFNTSPLLRFKTGKQLVKRLRTVQEAKEEFWDRWVKKVFPSLHGSRQVECTGGRGCAQKG